MLEQAYLHEQVDELIAKTRTAADLYQRFAAQNADPAVRDQLNRLHRDKLRHAELAERLREIVE